MPTFSLQRTLLFVITIASFGPSLAASRDPFLLAVSFALTGSDGAALDVVSRQDCVFRVGRQTFFLNEVYTDRLSIPSYSEQLPGQVKREFSLVKLHGATTIYEADNTLPNDLKAKVSEMTQKPVVDSPPTLLADYELRIDTNEGPRLIRAWQYVYQHGCRGKASPF